MFKKKKAIAGQVEKMGRIGNRPYWVLALSIFIRAAHQVGAAVFLAAYLLGEPGPPSTFFLYLVTGSGAALVCTEWLRHREILREFSGVATFLKLVLLGLALHGLLPLKATVLIAFVLASVSSHAPKLLRHRLLF